MGCGKSASSANHVSSTGEVTLHYFDGYGRAEVIRMILHYHGVSFTDHRVQPADWPALKAAGFAEFEALPVLEIDGHRLVETRAITRYLCRKFGYYPSDLTGAYWVESVCELKDDAFAPLMATAFKKDMEGLQKIYNEDLGFWLGKMEGRLKRNNGGNGWFVGNKVSLADFEIFAFVWDWCLRTEVKNRGGEAILAKNAPKLQGFVNRFLASSMRLKSYMDSRKSTPI